MTDTLTQRVMQAFYEADKAGCTLEQCWQEAIKASGAKHLQGFNLLSEKQPHIGEYCLCICDSDNHVYFCTSHYHGKISDNRYGTCNNTCGFYCHSVVAWMGESQMRNMAREILAALPPELRGEV